MRGAPVPVHRKRREHDPLQLGVHVRVQRARRRGRGPPVRAGHPARQALRTGQPAVPVHDRRARRVRDREPRRHLVQHPHRVRHRYRARTPPPVRHEAVEGAAGDVLHGEVRPLSTGRVRGARVEDPDDVGVPEPGQQHRLRKQRLGGGTLRDLPEDLHRLPPQVGVPHPVDLAVRAPPEPPLHHVSRAHRVAHPQQVPPGAVVPPRGHRRPLPSHSTTPAQRAVSRRAGRTPRVGRTPRDRSRTVLWRPGEDGAGVACWAAWVQYARCVRERARCVMSARGTMGRRRGAGFGGSR